MQTVRWLKVKWPIPTSEVSKRLLSRRYNEVDGRGFLLSKSGKQRTTGKYIEKLVEPSLTIDPFGNETKTLITTYYVAKFSFDKSSDLMELDSPPRSIRKLVSELHSIVGLGMEFTDITLDPLVWVEELEALRRTRVIVRNISSSGISVPKNGLAKISVSGKRDIRDEFTKLVGKKKRVIDLVKFNGVLQKCSITAELTRSGSIKYSGQEYDSFKEDVKKCMKRTLRKQR